MPAVVNAKHEAFARAIVEGKAGRDAYRSAGYKAPNDRAADASASRLLTIANISARIDELKQAAADHTVATARQVLQELTKVGLANMQDFVGPGFEMREISDLTRDQAGVLSEIAVETFMDGRGEDAREVRRVKFKLADKLGALNQLARHHKLLTDKHEHTGKDGRPLSRIVPVINLYGRPDPGDDFADAAR
jgi:phage terminase small subunit